MCYSSVCVCVCVFIGQASPFLLLTLHAPLEGVEGALLRSILDIICLNNVDAACLWGNAPINEVVDLHSPLLSLDDSLALIGRTGLDHQLRSLLGQNNAEPVTEPDQDRDTPGPNLDTVGGESQTPPETEVQAEEEEQREAESVPLAEVGSTVCVCLGVETDVIKLNHNKP